MGTDLPDRPDHKDVKLSYTIFPKDATAKQIYEHLMAQAEEEEKARAEARGRVEPGGMTPHNAPPGGAGGRRE